MASHFTYFIFFFFVYSCQGQPDSKIKTGAEQLDRYLPKLKNKNVGLFVNHTSLVSDAHLTDTLISHGVSVKKVFSPEHGFKGNKPDGEKIEHEHSAKFELVSLYGTNRKPNPATLEDLDILVIDIQDVGVRFYTYASTMTYLLEACAAVNVPVLLLDRPNPNGRYVDGPVLDERFESFIGLHPIPIVHGLTLGELATMINEEGWLSSGKQCELEVITSTNWDHNTPYSLPIKPSPNLPNDLSISLYPSLALFEGTIVSVGRGTDYPFQIIGHPKYTEGTYTFTPEPNQGSKYPPLQGLECKGIDFSKQTPRYSFTLAHLINFYQNLKGRTQESFFNNYFVKLAGTDELQKQIESGWSEEQIRESWQPGLREYKKVREKYLLYKDE